MEFCQQRRTPANHQAEDNEDNNNDTGNDNEQKCLHALRIFCDYNCSMYYMYVRHVVSVLYKPLTLYLTSSSGTFGGGVHSSLTFVSSIMATNTLGAAGP